jgi:hypothetical protein
LKVKFEIDTDPPGEFQTEAKYLLNPIEFYVKVFTAPDLFAGKLHALLFREWKHRVKGRDWYDLIWFIKNHHPLNLQHLQARMRQSGKLATKTVLSSELLQTLLRERILSVDFSAAKADIQPFIDDPSRLAIWSQEFFLNIVRGIKIQDP